MDARLMGRIRSNMLVLIIIIIITCISIAPLPIAQWRFTVGYLENLKF
jgi:hypothetical protein